MSGSPSSIPVTEARTTDGNILAGLHSAATSLASDASQAQRSTGETLNHATSTSFATKARKNSPPTRPRGAGKSRGSPFTSTPLQRHSPLTSQLVVAGYYPQADAQPPTVHHGPGHTFQMAPLPPVPTTQQQQNQHQTQFSSPRPQPSQTSGKPHPAPGPLYFLGYPSTYPMPYQRTPPPIQTSASAPVDGTHHPPPLSTSGSSTPARPSTAPVPGRPSQFSSKLGDETHGPYASTSKHPIPSALAGGRDGQMKRNASQGEGYSGRPSKKARNDSSERGHIAKRPRGGRAHGSINYREEDVSCLLDLAEKYLPVKRKGWKEVHAAYSSWAKLNNRQPREMKALKTKFLFLAHYKKSMDDLKNPEAVRRAKQIDEAIKKKMTEGGFEGEGEGEEESEGSSNESEGEKSDEDDERALSQHPSSSNLRSSYQPIQPAPYNVAPNHPEQYSRRSSIPSMHQPGSTPFTTTPVHFESDNTAPARRDLEREETIRHLMTLNTQLSEKDREIRKLQDELWTSEREKNRLLRSSEQEKHDALRERDRLQNRVELMSVRLSGNHGAVGAMGMGLGLGIAQGLPDLDVAMGLPLLQRGANDTRPESNQVDGTHGAGTSFITGTTFEISIPNPDGGPAQKYTVTITPSASSGLAVSEPEASS